MIQPACLIAGSVLGGHHLSKSTVPCPAFPPSTSSSFPQFREDVLGHVRDES
jgi:hypothetical protein